MMHKEIIILDPFRNNEEILAKERNVQDQVDIKIFKKKLMNNNKISKGISESKGGEDGALAKYLIINQNENDLTVSNNELIFWNVETNKCFMISNDEEIVATCDNNDQDLLQILFDDDDDNSQPIIAEDCDFSKNMEEIRKILKSTPANPTLSVDDIDDDVEKEMQKMFAESVTDATENHAADDDDIEDEQQEIDHSDFQVSVNNSIARLDEDFINYDFGESHYEQIIEISSEQPVEDCQNSQDSCCTESNFEIRLTNDQSNDEIDQQKHQDLIEFLQTENIKNIIAESIEYKKQRLQEIRKRISKIHIFLNEKRKHYEVFQNEVAMKKKKMMEEKNQQKTDELHLQISNEPDKPEISTEAKDKIEVHIPKKSWKITKAFVKSRTNNVINKTPPPHLKKSIICDPSPINKTQIVNRKTAASSPPNILTRWRKKFEKQIRSNYNKLTTPPEPPFKSHTKAPVYTRVCSTKSKVQIRSNIAKEPLKFKHPVVLNSKTIHKKFIKDDKQGKTNKIRNKKLPTSAMYDKNKATPLEKAEIKAITEFSQTNREKKNLVKPKVFVEQELKNDPKKITAEKVFDEVGVSIAQKIDLENVQELPFIATEKVFDEVGVKSIAQKVDLENIEELPLTATEKVFDEVGVSISQKVDLENIEELPLKDVRVPVENLVENTALSEPPAIKEVIAESLENAAAHDMMVVPQLDIAEVIENKINRSEQMVAATTLEHSNDKEEPKKDRTCDENDLKSNIFSEAEKQATTNARLQKICELSKEKSVLNSTDNENQILKICDSLIIPLSPGAAVRSNRRKSVQDKVFLQIKILSTNKPTNSTTEKTPQTNRVFTHFLKNIDENIYHRSRTFNLDAINTTFVWMKSIMVRKLNKSEMADELEKLKVHYYRLFHLVLIRNCDERVKVRKHCECTDKLNRIVFNSFMDAYVLKLVKYIIWAFQNNYENIIKSTDIIAGSLSFFFDRSRLLYFLYLFRSKFLQKKAVTKNVLQVGPKSLNTLAQMCLLKQLCRNPKMHECMEMLGERRRKQPICGAVVEVIDITADNDQPLSVNIDQHRHQTPPVVPTMPVAPPTTNSDHSIENLLQTQKPVAINNVPLNLATNRNSCSDQVLEPPKQTRLINYRRKTIASDRLEPIVLELEPPELPFVKENESIPKPTENVPNAREKTFARSVTSRRKTMDSVIDSNNVLRLERDQSCISVGDTSYKLATLPEYMHAACQKVIYQQQYPNITGADSTLGSSSTRTATVDSHQTMPPYICSAYLQSLDIKNKQNSQGQHSPMSKRPHVTSEEQLKSGRYFNSQYTEPRSDMLRNSKERIRQQDRSMYHRRDPRAPRNWKEYENIADRTNPFTTNIYLNSTQTETQATPSIPLRRSHPGITEIEVVSKLEPHKTSLKYRETYFDRRRKSAKNGTHPNFNFEHQNSATSARTCTLEKREKLPSSTIVAENPKILRYDYPLLIPNSLYQLQHHKPLTHLNQPSPLLPPFGSSLSKSVAVNISQEPSSEINNRQHRLVKPSFLDYHQPYFRPAAYDVPKSLEHEIPSFLMTKQGLTAACNEPQPINSPLPANKDNRQQNFTASSIAEEELLPNKKITLISSIVLKTCSDKDNPTTTHTKDMTDTNTPYGAPSETIIISDDSDSEMETVNPIVKPAIKSKQQQNSMLIPVDPLDTSDFMRTTKEAETQFPLYCPITESPSLEKVRRQNEMLYDQRKLTKFHKGCTTPKHIVDLLPTKLCDDVQSKKSILLGKYMESEMENETGVDKSTQTEKKVTVPSF